MDLFTIFSGKGKRSTWHIFLYYKDEHKKRHLNTWESRRVFARYRTAATAWGCGAIATGRPTTAGRVPDTRRPWGHDVLNTPQSQLTDWPRILVEVHSSMRVVAFCSALLHTHRTCCTQTTAKEQQQQQKGDGDSHHRLYRWDVWEASIFLLKKPTANKYHTIFFTLQYICIAIACYMYTKRCVGGGVVRWWRMKMMM